MAEKRGPIILVLGMPGSGKGTQCKRLASQYGLVHVSIGDLVREQSESGTELGRAVKEYMSRGDFVPDEVMLGIVKDRLAKPDILKHGVLLDGFPRSRAQAEGFVKLFNANLFLLFQCSDDVAVARCLGRLQDPETGAIYHKEFVPAPEAVRSRLTVRDNDNDEGIVRQRLQAYNGYVTAVVELFERTCSVVNGELSTDQVFEVVKTLVETVPGVSAAGKDEDDWSDDEEAPKVEGPQLCIEVAPSENRIAPFGKEDTAQELQHHAARTQDTLVDAVENAEVAEIKRAVFRALTRLRAASIKEFDTIARLETQAIDEYNDAHHYRAENPLSYLHADEPQVTEDKFTSFH